MNRDDAIRQAHAFAQHAYNVEAEKLRTELAAKLAAYAADCARRNLKMSGSAVQGKIKIKCEHVTALVEAYLEALLEGYALFGVEIDDQLSASIQRDVWDMKNRLVGTAKHPHNDIPKGLPISAEYYGKEVESGVRISPAWILTEITRRRFMKKKDAASSITNYHMGDQSRVNINSTDQSVNVQVSADQVFANLRHELQSRLPDLPERTEILDKLTALEAAQNTRSFGRRYSEFVASAANHMQLIAPFLPQLTELVKQALT